MNRVLLIGHLTAKPQLSYTSSNIAYCRFTIAVNRTIKDANGERQADFINCVIWRKPAENVANYLDKGSLVSVEGRIQTGSYTDKDGNKRSRFDVIADNVQFLDSKKTEQKQVEQVDIYKEFGDNIEVDDNFLD